MESRTLRQTDNPRSQCLIELAADDVTVETYYYGHQSILIGRYAAVDNCVAHTFLHIDLFGLDLSLSFLTPAS